MALFFSIVHLIGSKADKWKRRTVTDIAQEKGCRISVKDEFRNNVCTMTLVVEKYGDNNHQLALRLDDICEKIQELLMDYLDFIGDPGAKGRLIYEVALSSTGRMKGFRNDIVRARDPYGFGSFITLVELPSVIVPSSNRKTFHAKYILQKPILREIKRLACFIKICGDDFGTSLKLCEYYVIVSGTDPQRVDEAAHMVKKEISCHMEHCNCKLAFFR